MENSTSPTISQTLWNRQNTHCGETHWSFLKDLEPTQAFLMNLADWTTRWRNCTQISTGDWGRFQSNTVHIQGAFHFANLCFLMPYLLPWHRHCLYLDTFPSSYLIFNFSYSILLISARRLHGWGFNEVCNCQRETSFFFFTFFQPRFVLSFTFVHPEHFEVRCQKCNLGNSDLRRWLKRSIRLVEDMKEIKETG